jgi:hypothetical protein
VIQGQRIRFATVDLAAGAGEVRAQLLGRAGEGVSRVLDLGCRCPDA